MIPISLWRITHGMKIALAAISLTMAACVSTGTQSGSTNELTQLTAADIRKENVATAYDAVDWLARWWFHDLSGNASGGVAVYLDSNRRLGGMESLRDVRAADVFLLQYMKSAEAMARFGPDASGGAIVVTLR